MLYRYTPINRGNGQFTHIQQGYLLKAATQTPLPMLPGQLYECPSATESTSRRMNKSISRICSCAVRSGDDSLCNHGNPGLHISLNFYLPDPKDLPFFKADYVEFRRKLYWHSLARLTVLLAPGHRAVGYVKHWNHNKTKRNRWSLGMDK